MKKILFICLLMFGMNMYSQANYDGESTDVNYVYLDLINDYGTNIVDFRLSYDNYNGQYNCYNNIKIIAEDIDINIKFKIYLNDVEVYSGWAKLPAYTSYYLDDAFYDCNSTRKEIKIVSEPRYE